VQLFDGHPNLLVHPHELQIGFPEKWRWPELDLSQDPSEWLARLFERSIARFLVEGYSKPDGNPLALADRKPFKFSLEALVAEFTALAAKAKSRREVIDAYLSAYFAAWQDEFGFAEKRWFVGFCPRLLSYEASIKGFFEDYPDGRLVSSIRDPLSWYASSARHDAEYRDIARATELWKESTEATLRLAAAHPRRVHVVTYEDLVRDTKGLMERLTSALGLAMNDALLTPTFAGAPTLPNSSFAIGEYGVHQQSVDAAGKLSAEEIVYLEGNAMSLYDRAKRTAL
jgi:hypothetical protein